MNVESFDLLKFFVFEVTLRLTTDHEKELEYGSLLLCNEEFAGGENFWPHPKRLRLIDF